MAKKSKASKAKKASVGKKATAKTQAIKTRSSTKAASAGKPRGSIKVIRTISEMRKFVAEARSRKRKIALVPTMGFLHEGHLSLVREAKKHAPIVIVSVFVNPTQFGPTEDLARYPRDFAGDRRKLMAVGTDVMFVPDTSEMYPEGSQTFVEVTEVTKDLCGASRPGHFRGVATVVAKLFHIVRPDVAVFGEKDYQQLVTIRQMVRDLTLDLKVVGLPTVREEDGLAMSSRNAYLSPAQRQQATAIYRGLRKARKLLEAGERDAAELVASVMDLLREEQDLEIEYVTVCDSFTLERIPQVEREAVLLVAVRIGNTRLIDNMRLDVRRKR
jgi:pantoate--beta-alanine ligase